MTQNLPGIIIFSSTWLLITIAGLRAAPEAGLIGAAGAGFVLALPLCLPAALICGLIARLFIR